MGIDMLYQGNLENKKKFTNLIDMAYDIDKVIHEYGDFDFTAVDETEYEAVQEERRKKVIKRYYS